MADSKKAGRKASSEFQKDSFDAGNKPRDATSGHSVQGSSDKNRTSGEKVKSDKAPQSDSFFDDGSKAGRTESKGKSHTQREFQGREREKTGGKSKGGEKDFSEKKSDFIEPELFGDKKLDKAAADKKKARKKRGKC